MVAEEEEEDQPMTMMSFVELMRIEELTRRRRRRSDDGGAESDDDDRIDGGEEDDDDDYDDDVRLGERRGERHGERRRRFMSLIPSNEPGGGSSYGGHVFAQAVWAAAGTVEEGLVAHNVHGFFTLPGLPDRPYVYSVAVLSSGRSYATRYVTVKQPLVPSSNFPYRAEDCKDGLSEVCFACLVSFKRDERVSDEESGTGHQMRESVVERLGHVFKGLKPENLERSPDVDAPWYHRHISIHPEPAAFPGLDMRKLTIPSTDPASWINLVFYRPIGIIPPSAYNLHACAHMYASDRNSIEIVSNALGWGDEVGSIGSLSHSVVFHVSREQLVMREGEWWVQEARTRRSGQGRGVHESWIWKLGAADGGWGAGDQEMKAVHVASQWQEGMVRRVQEKGGQRQRLLWEEGMRKKALRSKKSGAGEAKSKL